MTFINSFFSILIQLNLSNFNSKLIHIIIGDVDGDGGSYWCSFVGRYGAMVFVTPKRFM